MSIGYPTPVNLLGGYNKRGVCRASLHWGCDDTNAEALLASGIALQDWLTQAGLPLQKVELKNVGAGERGLVATRKLYKGDRLLSLPSPLTITTNSEWTCSEAGKLLKEKELPDWPLLACYLISEASLGRSSRWYNYIAALPRRPGSILQWTVSDIETHLSPTSLKDKSIQCIQEVEDTYKDLKARIFSKHASLFPPEVFNMESFKWAFGILFSRLVRLPSLNQQLALVPFGDMLNHGPGVTTFLDFDSSSKTIICSLDRGYDQGNEVFISYGRRSNAELLMAYGFVPSGTNPADLVNITLSLDPKDVNYKAKLAALEKHGLSSSQTYPIRLNGWPTQLTAFARLTTCASSEQRTYSELCAAATEEGNKRKSEAETEETVRAYELILSACEKSITACRNYLERKDVHSRSSLSKLAIALCESELKILYRNQYVLRSELRIMRSGKTTRNIFDRLFK